MIHCICLPWVGLGMDGDMNSFLDFYLLPFVRSDCYRYMIRWLIIRVPYRFLLAFFFRWYAAVHLGEQQIELIYFFLKVLPQEGFRQVLSISTGLGSATGGMGLLCTWDCLVLTGAVSTGLTFTGVVSDTTASFTPNSDRTLSSWPRLLVESVSMVIVYLSMAIVD